MTLEEIERKWKESAGHTDGAHDYRQRLIERQNLIFNLLLFIAKKIK